MKLVTSAFLLWSALQYNAGNNQTTTTSLDRKDDQSPSIHRRLSSIVGDAVPSYLKDLNNDLLSRKQLFEGTPPEEIKYWFEYAGPLQVSE